MTNREKFDIIGKVFANYEDVEIRDEILGFVEKQIAALDHKNETAKKRAAEKRAAGDALRERVLGVMNDEPITVDGILAALNEDGLTPAKITARTRQLVAAGEIEKVPVKVEGRKLVGYIRA